MGNDDVQPGEATNDLIYTELLALRGDVGELKSSVKHVPDLEVRQTSLERRFLALMVALAVGGVRLVGPHVVNFASALVATVVS